MLHWPTRYRSYFALVTATQSKTFFRVCGGSAPPRAPHGGIRAGSIIAGKVRLTTPSLTRRHAQRVRARWPRRSAWFIQSTQGAAKRRSTMPAQPASPCLGRGVQAWKGRKNYNIQDVLVCQTRSRSNEVAVSPAHDAPPIRTPWSEPCRDEEQEDLRSQGRVTVFVV